jgi:hypothetical protein
MDTAFLQQDPGHTESPVEQNPYKPKFSELNEMPQILIQERKKQICRKVERQKQSHLVMQIRTKLWGYIHHNKSMIFKQNPTAGCKVMVYQDQGHTTITSPRRFSNVSWKLLIKSA